MGHTIITNHHNHLLPVHPHLRGAYIFGGKLIVQQSGSSPPTWGIRSRSTKKTIVNRFIPTYVGHTWLACWWPPCFPVHPHLRGAYRNLRHPVTSASGSSPPTWGIRFVNLIHHDISGSSPPTWGILFAITYHPFSDRFIPTYVGHTKAITSPMQSATVHPHLRGAYWSYISTFKVVTGSSPPTWGIHIREKTPRPEKRFIPTYVGHTKKG